MPRGDYGYDAPYFPIIFGVLSAAAAAAAAILFIQGLNPLFLNLFIQHPQLPLHHPAR